MENAGDWIYLLLILVAGVSGLISSIRKEKQKKESAPPPEPVTYEEAPVEKDFWDFLQEKLEEQATPAPKEVVVKSQIASQKKKKAISNYERQQASKSKHHTTIQPLKETPRILEEEPFKDPEELRKAVIYAEILNRKY